MIDSVAALRTLYPQPTGRSVAKQLDRLDVHCQRFVGLSPFLVLATAGRSGSLDASPRGGAPGFVLVADDRTLWPPDASGNDRLDSLTNVVEVGRAGLLVPGVDETHRVNGRARARTDADALGAFASERRPPRSVLEVEEAFLHCAKALMRSRLWDSESRQDRSILPSTGQILNEQTGAVGPAETHEDMVARYKQVL